MIFALLQILSVMSCCPQGICTLRHLNVTSNVWKHISINYCLYFQKYPLLVIIGYEWLSGCSSGVVAATHSSRSSSNGWWVFCSTLAMMGIKEPRGKLADAARPEKSSTTANRSLGLKSYCKSAIFSAVVWCFIWAPTIHKCNVEH